MQQAPGKKTKQRVTPRSHSDKFWKQKLYSALIQLFKGYVTIMKRWEMLKAEMKFEANNNND